MAATQARLPQPFRTSTSVEPSRAVNLVERIIDIPDLKVNLKTSDRRRHRSHQIDLTPRGIREHLQLNKPIYQRTAAYGHFGREPDADGGFSWEKTDLVEALKKAV